MDATGHVLTDCQIVMQECALKRLSTVINSEDMICLIHAVKHVESLKAKLSMTNVKLNAQSSFLNCNS